LPKKILIGLIGEGIQNSLTPDLHMREARTLGFDYDYRIIDVLEESLSGKPLEELLAEARDAGFDALNVTYPFKQAVIGHLAEVSQEVGQLHSANLILDLQGNSRGENTDWTGFEFALNQSLQNANRGLVIQVGVGGAGSATAYALLRWGVEHLVLADLDVAKANELAARYGQLFPKQKVEALALEQALALLPGADGVVNATPIGMYTHPGLPFDISSLQNKAWVADVIYRPMDTDLIVSARAAGHTVVPGGLMAIGQAVDSLRMVTGCEPSILRMTAHFFELLQDESVLTRARGLQ